MPINKQLGHVHRFKRHRYKTGAEIYFCVNDCTFRVGTELALGKISECNRCGKPFKMNKYSITLDKPHCEDCHNHKDDKRKSKSSKSQIQTIQPLTVVSDSMSEEVVDGLKQRLNDLIFDHGNAPGMEGIKSVEIKEFKLEDEEEFL